MAKKTFKVHLDLSKQELLNARLQNLATPPTVAATDIGFTYWNTADKTAYSWTGTAWIDLGQVYTHPSYPGTAQPVAALTGAKIITQIILEEGHVKSVVTRDLTAADIGAAAANHTHTFSQITGLPANTIMGNNTTSTGNAKALTVGELMTMMSIGYGTDALLTAGTDTTQRTWSAKQIYDYVNGVIDDLITVVNLGLGTRTATTLPITNSAGTGVTLPVATATLAGLLSGTDKAKLDGIESGANKYVHPTANPGVHPFATEITSGVQVLSQMVVNTEGHVTNIKGRNLTAADLAAIIINNVSNSATTQTWSASKIYTEIQVAINQAQTGALQYKGNYNPATNTPAITTDNTIKTGYTYVVSATGTFAGEAVEAGDMIIAKLDNPGATSANWQIVNKNIPAIVTATTTIEGIIRLATQAEALAGTNATAAITPATLKAVLDSRLGKYVANFGDGTTTNFTITHGLGTQDVDVTVLEVATREEIIVQWAAQTATTVTVGVNVAPANNEYRILIKAI